MRKILSVLLVIVWMMLMFSASNENGADSSSKSKKIIVAIATVLTDVKKDSKEMEEIVKKYSTPVRKTAHFVEYFILALFVMNAVNCFKIKYSSLIISGVICILFAISDEIHQLYIANRSGQISDVLLDSSASLIGIYIYYLLCKRKSFVLKKK